ncbi:MAG TPA: serine/threonine-protein kinase [Steroidobacteraceae bacterium]|nr:serine/threonine-protein kinase [Steroidobacteraceae bacterium]
MSLHVAPGIRIADRYTLGEKLGSGGQGEVWMAFDEQELESVALKILLRTFAPGSDTWDTLQREYAVVCDLDHPRILKTYPPLCVGDLAILPMKLATGGDLRQLRGAPYLEIIPALIDLAHALQHAHAHGVVHRDLKPANVLFDAAGRIQLADFGVAGRSQEGMQIDAARAGWSPSSASPQQLTGLPPAPADDLYGLGALTFELLTGTPPYFPDFAVRRVLNEPVPVIEPVHVAPASLLGLVRSLLAKNPRHRLQPMGEVITALTAALDDPPTWEYSNLGASARELAVTSDVIPEC